MSKEKIVTTIKNEELPISKCKKFPAGYYKIGNLKEENSGDCYYINGRFLKEETGNIVFNNSIKEYVIKDESLVHGIIDFEENNIKFGYYNKNINSSIIILENGSKYNLMDINVLKNNLFYREELSSGNFYHIKKLPAKNFNLLKIPSQEYKFSLPYDSKSILDHHTKLYNENYNPEIFENVKNYSKLLGNLSFGLEFETVKGFLPSRITDTYGLIPLRDGSISGLEYVTVPMTGEKGLQCVVDILPHLQQRTQFDNSCSLHLHIGNMPRTKEWILAFFKVTCAIQDEIYQMFPLFKKYNFGVKNKNYSKPFPIFELLSVIDPIITDKNINENFSVLYNYFSMGQDFGQLDYDINNIKVHPADPQNNQKWNIKTRYYLHNMIPLIFGNKKTVEFRIHTPTYDVNKIIPFILFTAMIVNYTTLNQEKILKVKYFLNKKTINKIILEYLQVVDIKNKSTLLDSFKEYFDIRKSCVERDNRKGNIIGDENTIKISKIIDWSSNIISIKETPLRNPIKINHNISQDLIKEVSNFLKIKDQKWYNIEPNTFSFIDDNSKKQKPIVKDDISS